MNTIYSWYRKSTFGINRDAGKQAHRLTQRLPPFDYNFLSVWNLYHSTDDCRIMHDGTSQHKRHICIKELKDSHLYDILNSAVLSQATVRSTTVARVGMASLALVSPSRVTTTTTPLGHEGRKGLSNNQLHSVETCPQLIWRLTPCRGNRSPGCCPHSVGHLRSSYCCFPALR